MQFPQLRSVEEFVAWEESQERKYEFAEGVVSLFSGGTIRHEILVANLIALLHAVAGPGYVRASSLKQLTDSSSRYPDISVGFDPRDTAEQTFARYPKLLVEVLSPSTYRVDRGPKFDEYRTIETLEEYVLVDSRKRWAQTIRRSGADWIVSLPILCGDLWFESISASFPFDAIYAGTEL
jgi:Uma2 family endonuclease